jgi:protein O-mannosyl-transferase
MADRYTYITLIGLFIMVAWGVPDLLKKWKHQKEILLTLSALSILCLSIITWTQVGYWQDNITLYDHTLKVTDNNWNIYYNRCNAYADLANYKHSIEDFNTAIHLKPTYVIAYYNRGTIYGKFLSQDKLAIEDFNKAISLKPDHVNAYKNRAVSYLNQGYNISGCRDMRKACELGNRKLLEAANARGLCR